MKKTDNQTRHLSSNKVNLIALCAFLFAVFTFKSGFSQLTCTGASTLANTASPACVLGTATNACTLNAIAPLTSGTCSINMSGWARERWIQFTAMGSTATITAVPSPTLVGANIQLALIAYSGTCGSLTQIGCANSIPISDVTTLQSETVTLTGLTTGTAYYIRVISEGNAAGTGNTSYPANLCVRSTLDNDEPGGAFPLTVGSTSVCSLSTYTVLGATSTTCSPSIPNPSCASYVPGTTADIWLQAVVPISGNLIINTNQPNSGMAVYSGTNAPGCGTMTELICTQTGSAINPLFPGVSLTGLTSGTYYIRLYRTGASTTPFGVCATSVPITPPANDNPCGALLVTASTTSVCGISYTTSIYGATASAPANAPAIGCSGLVVGAADDDVWAAFTATSTTQQIAITSFTPSAPATNQDFYIALYAASGPTTCPTVSGSELLCSPSNTATVSGLTVGNRYLIRFFNETAVSGFSTAINFCITTPTVANNDECTGAVQVTPDAGSACTNTVSGTLLGATASFQNNGCAVGDDNDDVWYNFTATSTSHSITITTASSGDFYHSVYAGVCGNIGPAIVCADPNSSVLYNLTVGANYFVRIYSTLSAALTGTNAPFVLCINTPTNSVGCFNPPGDNNFCPTPTSLSQSPYTFTGTVGAPPVAGGLYTSDVPGNLGSVFGGSIESNSWYSFIAVTPTHTFNIVPTTACTVQARVLNVTTSGGCCTSFTSMSNFYSSTASGTLTATGLTVGNTYYLMVDGNSTSNCAYSIPTWVLTSTLPLEYVSFIGYTEGKMNILEWITASENDKSKFTLEHSKDGIDFENVITMNGKGTNDGGGTYKAYDENPFDDITYYRLKHTDNSSVEKYSNIISVNLKNKYDLVTNLHPNPTTNDLYFDYFSKTKNTIAIELVDYSGKTVLDFNQLIEEGQNAIVLPLSDLDRGVYILKVISDKAGNASRHKVIKN